MACFEGAVGGVEAVENKGEWLVCLVVDYIHCRLFWWMTRGGNGPIRRTRGLKSSDNPPHLTRGDMSRDADPDPRALCYQSINARCCNSDRRAVYSQRPFASTMSVAKKRKLSPGASSRASSSTPAPSLPTHIHTDQTNESPDSPTPFDTLSVPGPSRSTFSASATPIPSSSTSEIIQEARTGAIVPNSGDGIDTGEECFLWADLPMNKQGQSGRHTRLTRRVPIYRLYTFHS